jgi:hypothetical protein
MAIETPTHPAAIEGCPFGVEDLTGNVRHWVTEFGGRDLVDLVGIEPTTSSMPWK